MMAGYRKSIPAATEAALWALSNERCYAPGCPFPVIVEIRAGIYRKNAQIAHIYGVRPGAPRYREGMPDEERDAFSNLLLLCMAHHAEVDDKKTGERFYSPDLLLKWKVDHEGSNGPALAALGRIDEDSLIEVLLKVFTPPVERLQLIADQLEKTGSLNVESLAELRQILVVMRNSPTAADRSTAVMLMEAAEVYSSRSFSQAASQLATAADILPSLDRSLSRTANRLFEAADLMGR